MEFESLFEQFQAAAQDFANGKPDPVKSLFSRGDDVTLANPFGPIAVGWHDVSVALDYASSQMRDGQVTAFERIATYATADLVSALERETWEVKIGDQEARGVAQLRVSTTLRREDGRWLIVHRHADPIATFDPRGPMRDIR